MSEYNVRPIDEFPVPEQGTSHGISEDYLFHDADTGWVRGCLDDIDGSCWVRGYGFRIDPTHFCELPPAPIKK